MLLHEERKEPSYQRLAARLRGEILSGNISGKMKPEKELADLFAVSYGTLRKAIGVLVDEGILQRLHGHGTFIRSPEQIQPLRAVGLLLPAGATQGAANPYYAHIVDGACREAATLGLGLAVSDRLATLFDPAASTAPRMADALIVCPHACTAPELARVSRFLPVILLEWDDLQHGSLTVDNAIGQRKAVEHLIGLGHKLISYISGPDQAGVQNAPGRERLNGFLDAMVEAGLSMPASHIVSGDFEFRAGYELAKQLLSRPLRPTAIACANDTMALGAMRYAHEAGLSVPRDLSITGFDDISAAEYCTPGLTTLAPPKTELGVLAVRHLRENALKAPAERTCIRLQAELIVRASTAPCAR